MKTKNLLLKLFLGCWLILLSRQGMAQSTYQNQSEIKDIAKTGFYQITLPPQIIAKCKADLSDIRIVDETGKTVPYVMQKDLPVNYKRIFVEFETVPADNDSTTLLLVKSNIHIPIKRLYLLIKNNTVQRSINLSGSDDLKKWYAISEDIPLNNSDNSGKDYYEQALTFPASSYAYYKVSIGNKNKAPVKILKAGIYTDDQFSGKYVALPAPVITQKDSGDVSYFKIKFNDNYVINRIHLNITGARFFKRNFALYTVDKAHLYANRIDSQDPNVEMLWSGLKVNELNATIDNGDNPPLKLSVDTYQLNQALLGYLEAGKKYRIVFGDSTAKAPNYDLGFFTDSIRKELKIVDLGPVKPNTDHKAELPKKVDFNFTYLMWGAIAVILLALAFFTYKMANEVKAKNL